MDQLLLEFLIVVGNDLANRAARLSKNQTLEKDVKEIPFKGFIKLGLQILSKCSHLLNAIVQDSKEQVS